MLTAKVAFSRPVDQYLRQLQEAMNKAVELLKTIVENIQPKSSSTIVESPKFAPSPTLPKVPEVQKSSEETKKPEDEVR